MANISIDIKVSIKFTKRWVEQFVNEQLINEQFADGQFISEQFVNGTKGQLKQVMDLLQIPRFTNFVNPFQEFQVFPK